MATNFPTSLDVLTNPAPTSDTVTVPHSTQHANANDSIEALEAKVGVNGSAVTTSHDYKLGEVTGADKAVGKTATQVITNKTLGAGSKVLVGSDATGDTYYNSGSGTIARRAIGSEGQILTVSGGIPVWQANASVDPNLYAPTGALMPYAGASAPTNWLLCDGSAVSRTTYSALFAITSTTYGVGDGSTTFNLPDLRSRIPLGAGTGTKVATFASRASNVITVTGLSNASNNEFQTGQAVVYVTSGTVITGLTSSTTYYVVRTGNLTFSLATSLANAIAGTVITLSSDGSGTQTFTQTLTTRTLGSTGGEENHALITGELPAHTHREQRASAGSGTSLSVAGGVPTTTPVDYGIDTQSTGGNTAHNIMNPFVTLNYIIRI